MALKALDKNGVLTTRELKAAIGRSCENLHWCDEFAEAFALDSKRLCALKRYCVILYPSTLRSILQHARSCESTELYEFAQACRSRFSMEKSPVGHVAGPQFEAVLDF
ncbi:MAG: hypothetical protein GY811_00685 [Myxococcales bacterium]|nr:hypothetical protein [Myxococcales bacterium]